MAIFWERAAHSVYRMFCLNFIYFESGTLVLIASVPGHCLSFTFLACTGLYQTYSNQNLDEFRFFSLCGLQRL